jgi:hypothetical protein
MSCDELYCNTADQTLIFNNCEYNIVAEIGNEQITASIDSVVVNNENGGTGPQGPPGSGSSSGLNQEVVQIDFGANQDELVVTPVTASWVTATTKIFAQPAGTSTTDHDPDDYGLEGVSSYIANINIGTGFDLITTTKNTTHGKYNINLIYS